MSAEQESPDELAAQAPSEKFAEGEESAPPYARVMAVVRWLLVAGMALAALLSVLHVYGTHGSSERHVAAEYFCPMHPGVVQDQPGDCPICGMSLVPREASPTPAAGAADKGHADAGHAAREQGDAGSGPELEGLVPIELSAQRLQLLGMRSAQVTRASLPSELRAVGYVAATEAGQAVIQTRFSGWIEQLHVAETGQLVQRGQLLARVYSPELLAAQQELLNAQRWGAGDASLASSARTRLELMGMDATEITQVEKEKSPHRLIEIRSPVRGYIAQKGAVQGLYIQPGTKLFELADLSKVWCFIELSERDAGRIKAGQRARLELAAYPGESFQGKVQLVYPTLNPETRTQRARVELANTDLRLRPGMFGEVRIEQGATEGLSIPREAVVDTGEQQYVFVVEAEGRFSPRKVQLGARFDDRIQVTSGLREGETVVTTGNFLIDSESRLRSALAGDHAH